MGAPRFGSGRPAHPRPRSCRFSVNCREGGHGTDRSGLGMNAKGRDAPELAVPGRPVTANSRPEESAGFGDPAPTLLAWHPWRQGRTIPPHITATHLGAPAEPPKPVLGLASKYSPGRATPAKCRSITNPPCGRDRIAAISWQQKVGPQPGRAANSQRGPELPRAEGPDRVSAWDWPGSRGGGRLDPGSSTGLGGPLAQSAASGQYAGPRPVKALG